MRTGEGRRWGSARNAPRWLTALSVFFLVAGLLSGECRSASVGSPPRQWRIFYLDSYDPGYAPSILTQKGARKVLEAEGALMEIFYLDEKRNPSEQALRQMALKARQRIEEWKPDAIIASDDPASRFVIVPFYRDKEIPVVFNGVNWDARPYGFPCRNVTGQVEVEVVRELLAELGKYARGKRVGILTGDTSTDRVNIAYYETVLGIRFDRKRLVTRLDDWKKAYVALQKEVDMLLLRSNGGIDGWDDAEVEAFVMEQSLVPSGSAAPHMAPFVMLNFAKVREEFGEHSATTVLAMLRKTTPTLPPITTNKQARVYLNMKLAGRLKIKFPMELIERSTFVEEIGR